jgi:hypothetical protein
MGVFGAFFGHFGASGAILGIRSKVGQKVDKKASRVKKISGFGEFGHQSNPQNMVFLAP